MNVISSSYGNDSIAMIQWAYENNLFDVVVVYCETGWGSRSWPLRVKRGESFAKGCGFETITIKPEIQFEELMKLKKGFPNQRYQWCSGLLKGIPFLNWIDEVDQDRNAVVLVGKRRAEGEKGGDRINTPGYINESEYHGGRTLWHPLFMHTDSDRNELLKRAGFDVLPHRSMECSPCVNANAVDFRSLPQSDVDKTNALELAVGKTMFRPKRHNGATGIIEVVKWAKYGQGKYTPGQDDLFSMGCGSPFGCGL